MKTLDEVIHALEVCMEDDAIESEGAYLATDALHYLKAYRELDSLDAVAFPEDDNPPLTWYELRTMEGKPVWVEFEKNGNHWLIITDIKSNGAVGRGVYGENVPLYKDRIGTDWQAYRKERK